MSKTRNSTPKLSDVARHVAIPGGITTTAWPSVRAECRRLGIEFDPWQDSVGRIAFGKRSDGVYAASIGGVVMSIPRQVGKTFFIGAVTFALCMLNPGLLVIWTAHQLATAGETFRSMQGMAKRPKVRPFIKQVRLGSGDEAIEFSNGSRILFGARERGFGLGFTKVAVLVLDEAQRVTEKTMDDLIPTMNQADNPLLFMVGTPPRPTDVGEEFKARRRKALAGKSEGQVQSVGGNMVYVEFGADATVRPEAWPQGHVDWKAVATANPSFPLRTPKAAVLRMLENLRPESLRREAFGVWDEDQAGSRAISADRWKATGVEVAPDGVKSFGVAFSFDGTRVAVAGAVAHGEAEAHVELLDVAGEDAGLAVLANWFCAEGPDGVKRWRNAGLIVLGGSAGAGVLKQLLLERRVPEKRIKVVSTPQYLQACAMLGDSLEAGTATHLASEGQKVLDDSVAVVDRDKRGGWMSTVPDGDETPVEAISFALWGARMSKRKIRTEEQRGVIL